MIRAFDQIFKAFSSRRQAAADETAQVRLAVAVDLGADRELARAVRAALLPRTATAKLYVAGYGPRGGMPAVNGLSDAAVVLAGPSAVSAAALWRAYGAAGVPCCVLAGPAAARAAAEAGVRGGDVLACDAAGVAEGLGSWLVGALPERASALGAGFACCRRARALLAAREAARGNALVGALPAFDGADLPVMLAAEVAMLWRIAGAYGLPLDVSRAAELAAVAASSFGLRGVSRAAVRALPLPAFAVRAGVAAAGTYAMGRALMALYERMGELDGPPPRSVEPLSVETVFEQEACL